MIRQGIIRLVMRGNTFHGGPYVEAGFDNAYQETYMLMREAVSIPKRLLSPFWGSSEAKTGPRSTSGRQQKYDSAASSTSLKALGVL